MRWDKIVDQEFGRYFVFGESANSVDVATVHDYTVAAVSRVHAEKLIAHRDELLDVIVRLADAVGDEDLAMRIILERAS